jgi:hypothetical protein
MMVRQCAHTTCIAEAEACLRFDYSARAAWVDDLDAVASPDSYDLCAVHADGLTVPVGWTRTDRRVTARPLFQAS